MIVRDSTQSDYKNVLIEKHFELLEYIDEVIDEFTDKELSVIRESLADSLLILSSTHREAEPPLLLDPFPLLDCEEGKFDIFDKWRRRIRLLADKMNNFNRK